MFNSVIMHNKYSVLLIITLFVLSFSLPVFAEESEMTLDQAREYFYSHNFDILIRQFEINKAQADLQGARLLPNPTLSADYTGLVARGLRAGDNTQMSYRIDQLIELGGKRGLRTGVATENLEATKLSNKDAVRNLLTVFYSLFFNLNLDLLNMTLAREVLAQFDKTLEIAEKRFNAGFLSAVDYTKLKIARIDYENSLTNFETQFKNDSEQFRVLIGSNTTVKPTPGLLQETLPAYREEELINAAYQRRYDLLSLQHQLKSTEYNVSLAKAGAIPDVTIGAEYENFGRQTQPFVGLGISLNIPIFNRNQAEIGRRKAEYRQIELQLDKARNQITSEVRLALHNYETSLKIFDVYNKKKTEVEALLSNSEKAFALGGITVLDLLDTRKTHREFMSKYNQAIVQSNLNKELLKVYTGEITWSD
jgi:cobalt-zinc-cadmium efflux system outer membrane protein